MKLRATILGVCCLALVGPTAAEAPLADHLPGQCLMYAGWAGRNLPLDGSTFGQLLRDPAVGNVLNALYEAAHKASPPPARATLQSTWSLAKIAWQHPIGVSLMDIRPGQSKATISAAVLVDLGKDKPAFAKHLDAILLNIGTAPSEATIGKVTYKMLPTPAGMLALGYMGNVFFLTIGPEAPNKLINLPPAGSLKADKDFAACWKDVGGPNEQFALYADLTAIKARLEKLAPSPAEQDPEAAGGDKLQRALEALGLGKATKLAGSIRIVDKGLYTKFRLLSPAPHRGLLFAAAGGQITEADLAGVPDDALCLWVMKLSPTAFYAEVRHMLKMFDPAAEEKFLSAVRLMDEKLGVSVSGDILANLGDTWTLLSASSLGGYGTGTVLTVGVKDVEKLRTAVAKIEALAGKQSGAESQPARPTGPALGIEVLKSGKLEVHYARLPGRPFMPVAPAWAIHNDKLYLALWPQVIVAAIENAGQRPLVKNDAFRKLRARLTNKASALVYVDTPQIARQVYNLYLIGWTGVANSLPRAGGLPVDLKPHWLPSLPRIEKYLQPEISVVWADAKGITIEGYGAGLTTGLSLAPVAVPVSAAILTPTIAHARGQAKRAVSMANLNAIAKAVLLYKAENESIPPDLAKLVEEGYISPEGLVSPTSGRTMPTDAKGVPTGQSDYQQRHVRIADERFGQVDGQAAVRESPQTHTRSTEKGPKDRRFLGQLICRQQVKTPVPGRRLGGFVILLSRKEP